LRARNHARGTAKIPATNVVTNAILSESSMLWVMALSDAASNKSTADLDSIRLNKGATMNKRARPPSKANVSESDPGLNFIGYKVAKKSRKHFIALVCPALWQKSGIIAPAFCGYVLE
jgi:hypothetical protein